MSEGFARGLPLFGFYAILCSESFFYRQRC